MGRSSVVNKSTDRRYVTSRSGISSPDELLWSWCWSWCCMVVLVKIRPPC